MPKVIEGNMIADGAKVGIVVARFNEFLTGKLMDAAIDTFKRHGGDEDALTVVWVPGSFELPGTALKMAQSGKYDAIICLGCVIRGSTGHYDFVAAEAAKGIGQAGMATGVPVVFGVITADTLEQAIDRSGAKQGNNGGKAMLTAIEMINLYKQL